ncbi:hypothetical protein GCM10009805_31220 [Leucobacter chromiireducens subsp. solipictus]
MRGEGRGDSAEILGKVAGPGRVLDHRDVQRAGVHGAPRVWRADRARARDSLEFGGGDRAQCQIVSLADSRR